MKTWWTTPLSAAPIRCRWILAETSVRFRAALTVRMKNDEFFPYELEVSSPWRYLRPDRAPPLGKVPVPDCGHRT